MPKQSDTGNVKKLCDCGRAKWSACAHPWYCDFKAPKDHPRRGISADHPNGERYRKNLNLSRGRCSGRRLREAQDEARRAITAWLDGRDPKQLQPADRPTLAKLLDAYGKRPNASAAEAFQVKPDHDDDRAGAAVRRVARGGHHARGARRLPGAAAEGGRQPQSRVPAGRVQLGGGRRARAALAVPRG